MQNTTKHGFTLAELLIALAILGVIATFTIPKVLQAQQDGKWDAAAKEAMAAVYGAYQAYQLDNSVSSSFHPSELTPYLNYIRIDTAGQFLDANPGSDWLACGSTKMCVQLASGGALYLTDETFGGSASTNAVIFHFDPDGDYTGDDNKKSILFVLYYGGRLTSMENVVANTCTQVFCPMNPVAGADPEWFSWEG